MVLLAHASHTLPASVAALLRFAGNGTLGVNIFFVVSGFLIFTLSVREVEKRGSFDWRQFYLRRVLRIFPCFYSYIAVLLLLMALGVIALSWQMLGSAATFTLNYRHLFDRSSGAYEYVLLGHYWTLSLEEQFYLTWPLLTFLFLKRKLLPILIAIVIGAPFIRVASYFLAPASRGQIGMMFHTGFNSIAAGVLLGEVLRRQFRAPRVARFASSQWLVAGAVLFLVFLSPLLNERFGGAYGITVGKSLELVAICFVIAAAVSFPETIIFQLLNWPPLAYVGVLSYSLYVWNNLFLAGTGHWFNLFPYNCGGAIGMALLSHYLIEKPFLRLRYRSRRADSAPIAPFTGVAA